MSEHEPDIGAESVPPQGDPVANTSQRVFARLTDWMLLFAAWPLIGGTTSDRLDDGTIAYSSWAVVTWILLVIIYEAGFVAAKGQTPGKMLVGIELVRLTDGGRPSLAAAVLRVAPVALAVAVLGIFFPIVMVFVYFSAVFAGDTRGLLDRIAGTVVIKARRGSGLLGHLLDGPG